MKSAKRNYDVLTDKERAALYIRASFRGDKVEADRLDVSAPKLGTGMAHHHRLVYAFCGMAVEHRMEQLERAGVYFISAQFVASALRQNIQESTVQAGYTGLVAAWEFGLYGKAFQRFCGNHEIESVDIVGKGSDFDVLELASAIILKKAPTKQELEIVAMELGIGGPPHMPDEDSVVDEFEKTLLQFL